MKVALVYDRVNKWGGAERILLSLHKLFPKAPLYTSVYDKKNAQWAQKFKVYTSFLQHIPFAKSRHEYLPFLMPFAFQTFDFSKYDVVISITSEFAKAIKVSGKTKHLCICLTPTRYLWSGYNEYFSHKLLKKVTKPLIVLLRLFDKYAAQSPDLFIAISNEVRSRIKKYYQRESIVIYPPVPKLPKSIKKIDLPQKYFLVVSRLSKFTQYKRVDLAIQAAKKMESNLIVVGNGDKKHLTKYLGSTITFVSNLSDRQLATYYKNAQALIFPGKEDFGLVMVESLSQGTPVIAYQAGGALEIVEKGKTGVFFKSQTVSSLVKVLKTFQKRRYNKTSCKKKAAQFSETVFQKKIKKIVLEMTKI